MYMADAGSQYMDGLQNIATPLPAADGDTGNGDESDDHDSEALAGEEPDMQSDYGPIPDIGFCASEEAWSSYIDKLSNLAKLDNIKIAMQFIQAMKAASLDDEWSQLGEDTLHQLQNPPTTPVNLDESPAWRLGLDLYLSVGNASQETYTSVRKAILRRYPNDEIPSFDQIKHYIAELSGVHSMEHDMSINSCLAYTGPYKDLERCPECGEHRYELQSKRPRQQLHTIPLGPQLQAIRRGTQSAQEANYRVAITEKILNDLDINDGQIPVIKDFFFGQAYIDCMDQEFIKKHDLVLMFSMDGAQLYANKVSDCWIYIWIIFDYHPSSRYRKKHVLVGGIIPGPRKPKIVDSFLFPGLHHLAALQREGLKMWNCATNTVDICHLFLGLATADGPGMTYLNGLVGHHGKNGCRLYCTLHGRHKIRGTHYYPALLKPDNYSIAGCDHPDYDIHTIPVPSSQNYQQNLLRVVGSSSQTQFKKLRLETGISKPSIFLGLSPLHRLDIPGCFGSDIMHLAALNIPDLLINLWRGTIDCDQNDDRSTWDWAVLQGSTWESHGKEIAACTPYLPCSFDRPPRNPAEKISSGYKAWEFLMYIYGLGPAMFYGVLPEKYWVNFCKLIYGMRIILQHEIATEDLIKAQNSLLEFCLEFEVLYYQRRPERLHFVRQSIHALLHVSQETVRIGPSICSSQWTMERTIGNLVEEIHQPSNPYANLSQRGLQRSQVNALKAMFPELDEDKNKLPRGAINLGNEYVLLRAMEQTYYQLSDEYLIALRCFISQSYNGILEAGVPIAVRRWARLRLPTGQVARSQWKESLKPLDKVRMARNVKVNLNRLLFFYFNNSLIF
jgi:hypothetical protein